MMFIDCLLILHPVELFKSPSHLIHLLTKHPIVPVRFLLQPIQFANPTNDLLRKVPGKVCFLVNHVRKAVLQAEVDVEIRKLLRDLIPYPVLSRRLDDCLVHCFELVFRRVQFVPK